MMMQELPRGVGAETMKTSIMTTKAADDYPRQYVEDMSDEEEDEDFDFDEEYFFRTYRPLSNLPTPPPSWKNSSAHPSPGREVDDDEELLPAFLGPAVHLVNLLPPAASLATPSVPLVQAILSRANLPMHTVALAVCIMDALNSRFPRQWRTSCPLAAYPDADLTAFDSSSSSGKRPASSFSSGTLPTEQPHIDSVCPELILLSALIIAAKFTEDAQAPTQWYAAAWGRRLWTCDQINATERCVMENLGYRIMPLAAPDVLDDALSDMARAALQFPPTQQTPSQRQHLKSMAMTKGSMSSQMVPRSCCVSNDGGSAGAGAGAAKRPIDESCGLHQQHRRSKSRGKATAALGGQQLTPEESP